MIRIPEGAARWTRRSLLAAGLGAGAAYALWPYAAHAPRTFGAQALAKPRPVHLPAHALSLFAVGDTGVASEVQAAVARAMAETAAAHRLDAVLLLGDNFYRRGVQSLDDPAWHALFEKPYAAASLRVPFIAALGNHDHGGNVMAQIERSAVDERWHMPAPYYVESFRLGDGSRLDLFVLDTYPIHLEERSADSQLRWLEAKLARSAAAWKIVAGHHPVLSGGKHGHDGDMARALASLFEGYGVQLYLAGHDHNLQLLQSPGRWLQLVSGSGSSVRDVWWVPETLYGAAAAGFAWIVVEPEALTIRMIEAPGGLVFEHRIEAQTTRVVPALAPTS